MSQRLISAVLDLSQLLQMLAILSVLLMIVTSRPAKDLAREIRATRTTEGGPAVIATLLLVSNVALQLLTGGLENRTAGASPLVTLPVVGSYLGLARPPRATLLLILISVGSLFVLLVLSYSRRGDDHGVRAVSFASFAPWVAWLLWVVLNTALHPRPEPASMRAFVASALAIAACIAALPHISARLVTRLLVLTGSAVLLLSALCLFLQPAWSNTLEWPGGFRTGERLQAIFPQPNTAGSFFAVSILIIANYAPWSRLSRALMISLGAYLVYETGSRGAVLILAAGVLVMLFNSRTPGGVRVVLAFAFLMASALVPLLWFSDAPTANSRELTAQRALALAREDWLIGGGAFPDHSSTVSAAIYAHTQIFQSLAEGGLVGTSLLAVAVLSTIRLHRAGSQPWAAAVPPAILVTFLAENPMRIFEPVFVPLLVLFLVAGRVSMVSEPAPASILPKAMPRSRRVPAGAPA